MFSRRSNASIEQSGRITMTTHISNEAFQHDQILLYSTYGRSRRGRKDDVWVRWKPSPRAESDYS